jgi:hypothetical protein
MKRLMLMIVVLASLAACGEKDQSLAATTRKSDQKSWEAQKSVFDAKGYEPGDKTRWDAQLRTRAQTQNEFNKAN